jgi:hypothetical protein
MLEIKKIIMFYKKEKAVVSVFAYIFYIMIGISIIALVVMYATNIINKYEEKYNYDQMIKTISDIEENINLVAKNKNTSKNIIVNNPQELLIDCENNKIIGKINYESEFINDQEVIINNIIIYKKNNNIIFERNISDNNIIKLNCTSLSLNKGKSEIVIKYSDYDTNTEKILIDFVNKKNRTNNWYNSNWAFRRLIIIESEEIPTNGNNIPVLINIKNSKLIGKIDSNTNDVVFTFNDGSTKLNRDILSYNENTGELISWVKIPLLSSTKDNYIYLYYGNKNATESDSIINNDINYSNLLITLGEEEYR